MGAIIKKNSVSSLFLFLFALSAGHLQAALRPNVSPTEAEDVGEVEEFDLDGQNLGELNPNDIGTDYESDLHKEVLRNKAFFQKPENNRNLLKPSAATPDYLDYSELIVPVLGKKQSAPEAPTLRVATKTYWSKFSKLG